MIHAYCKTRSDYANCLCKLLSSCILLKTIYSSYKNRLYTNGLVSDKNVSPHYKTMHI